MPDWSYPLFSLLLFVANLAAWLGDFYRLPGNWVIVCNAALFSAFFPEKPTGLGMGWGTVALLAILATLGESLAYIARQRRKFAARQQSPGWERTLISATAGGILGSFLGLAVPVMGFLLSTIGAIGGAAAGASLGTYWTGRARTALSDAPLEVLQRRELINKWLELGARLLIGLLLMLIATSASLAG